MNRSNMFVGLFLFAFTISSGVARGQVRTISNDVQSEFGAYHPYLVSVTPAVATYTVNPDFSDVANFKTLSSVLTEADKVLLGKNHFVSKPSNFKQVYSLYNYAKENGIPQFVTTDAVLHTFHILYDYSLRMLEVKRFADDVKLLNDALLQKMWAYYNQYASTADTLLKEALEKDVAYFTAVEYIPKPELLGSGGTPLSPPEQMAFDELQLIAAHQGFIPSPIFGYKEDYSQYIPRGHYTRNDTLKTYFKQMMWYGRMMFRVSPPKNDFTNEIDEEKAKEETLMAVLIVRAMNEVMVDCAFGGLEPAMSTWSRIYFPTTFYVGKSDDLDIAEYTGLLKEIYGGNYLSLPIGAFADTVKLSQFIVKARELRDPLINSSWVWETQDIKLVTKAFRFMGQRFIPDSYMFTELVHAKVSGRFFPKGLDVLSVFGSQRAFEILDKIFGETQYAGYAAKMDSLKSEFRSLSPETWAQNLYWNWLYCLAAMLMSKGEGYPPFMENVAWVDKELMTALASWGELRHDTILYGKQSGSQTTSVPTPPDFTYGYVEPNPHLYARLASLINLMRIGLENLGISLDEFRYKFNDLESLLVGLRTIAEKELENKELTLDEYRVIWTIGEHLEKLLTFSPEVSGSITSDTDNEMALVADVHTDANSSQVLEEGVGYPFKLYVIVRDTKGLRMTEGAMFSYYEFTYPMANRLSDEAWQTMLKGLNPPKPPVWAGSFIDMSQSYLNMHPVEFYVKTSGYTEANIAISPERPSVGDTVDITLVSKTMVGDTLTVVFKKGEQQLASVMLMDVDPSPTSMFSGRCTTAGWGAGTITVQMSARYFSNTYWFELKPAGPVTGIDGKPKTPETFSLLQNFPNPFNPSTGIEFSIPQSGYVTLRVYNTLGEEVSTIISQNLSVGKHYVQFDARGFPSGVYFYRLHAGDLAETKKLVLLR